MTEAANQKLPAVSKQPLTFPQEFLWGTATAAHQVEGNNTNSDWWAFEQRPGAIWHGDRSGTACDWWRNAEEDIDLMAQMGHTTHRLSIEWSRIEPQEGTFDPAAVVRYREILTAFRRHGIEPMVTLFHFSSPLWLAQQGGWSNPKVVGRFRRFVRYAVKQLGDLVTLWCTINEPSIYAAFGYLYGIHAPGEKSLAQYFRVQRHLLQAHAAAYRVIHAADGRAQVGLVKNVQVFEPFTWGRWLEGRAARLYDYVFDEIFFRAVQDGRIRFPLGLGLAVDGPLMGSVDFWGVNYYSRQRVHLERQGVHLRLVRRPTPGAPVSDNGREGTYGEIYPAGMYRVLKRAAGLGKPIYITENGLPNANDDLRPGFLLSTLAWVHRAIAEGVDVRGYYHWSFVDNFEWAEGWALRFGLVALDVDSGKRIPRHSARLFTEIARANAITPEMVREYAPEAYGGIFAPDSALLP
jgi:beta-glucosidase